MIDLEQQLRMAGYNYFTLQQNSGRYQIPPHNTFNILLCSNRTLEGEPTCTASLGGIGARKTCHLSILCTFHGKQRNTDDVLIKAVQIVLE